MKRLTVFVLVSIFFVLSSNGFAIELKGKFALSGIGNLGLPVGDFADEDKGAAKSGFGFGANLEYFVSDNFALGGSFSYPRFGTKTEDFEEAIRYLLYQEYGEWFNVDADLKQKIVSFGVFGKYLFSPYAQTRPYLKFGMGFGKYSLSGDIEVDGANVDVDGSVDSKLYVNLGSGIQHHLSENAALILEATYTHVFTDESEGELELQAGPFEATEDVEMDFNAQYFGIYAGVCFFFGGKK